MEDMVKSLLVWALPAFFAITMREAIRARVAWYMGDKQIERDGLLTFNPKAFVDPFGTLLFPLMFILQGNPPFGYGRRAVILPSHYRSPKLGAVTVALSGIIASLTMALIAVYLLPFVVVAPELIMEWLKANVVNFIYINCVLAVFHLIPLLPLDGGWLLMALLPNRLARKFLSVESYGILILVLILMVLPMMQSFTGLPVDFTQTLLWQPAYAIYQGLVGLLG